MDSTRCGNSYFEKTVTLCKITLNLPISSSKTCGCLKNLPNSSEWLRIEAMALLQKFGTVVA
jgi:hypothetical protein